MRRKLTWVAIVAVLAVIGYTVRCIVNEPGWIIVLAPLDRPIRVEVAGKTETIAPGTAHRFQDLAHGDYTVKVLDDAGKVVHQQAVTVTTDRTIVPANPDQCFVDVNVTTYLYDPSHAGDPSTLMLVARHGAGGKPFKWEYAALSDQDLPAKLSSKESARVLRQVPCGLLAQSDAEIFAALGYTRRTPGR